jgi:hypothetical protein
VGLAILPKELTGTAKEFHLACMKCHGLRFVRSSHLSSTAYVPVPCTLHGMLLVFLFIIRSVDNVLAAALLSLWP